eukprot:5508799-Amphidinium_carterae.1
MFQRHSFQSSLTLLKASCYVVYGRPDLVSLSQSGTYKGDPRVPIYVFLVMRFRIDEVPISQDCLYTLLQCHYEYGWGAARCVVFNTSRAKSLCKAPCEPLFFVYSCGSENVLNDSTHIWLTVTN